MKKKRVCIEFNLSFGIILSNKTQTEGQKELKENKNVSEQTDRPATKNQNRILFLFSNFFSCCSNDGRR
jgi:hypothetical protein